jgi:uncharacterized Zn finger protein (UPF0148 family)
MSDFDKEAEREKLRRRFEAEEEDRAVTEQMSELLLQGATMTNRHCNTCHSPIFAYQGQAFCPTCQVEVDDSGRAVETEAEATRDAGDDPTTTGQEPNPAAADDSRPATSIEVDDPGTGTAEQSAPSETAAPADAASNSDPTPDTEPGTSTADRASSPDPASTPEPASRPPADAGAKAEPTDRTRPAGTSHTTGSAGSTGVSATGGDDLAVVHGSLSRTLVRLSRTAEESEDLSRTREHLLAAQEAAEALAALEQARR